MIRKITKIVNEERMGYCLLSAPRNNQPNKWMGAEREGEGRR